MKFRNLDPKILLFSVFAVACLAAGIFVALWHQSQLSERASIRNTGQRTTAIAVSRSEVEFISTKGTIRAEPLVSPIQGTLQQQDSYNVIYDRNDPSRVVLVQDDSAYNITIWVVSAKLIGASAVLTYFIYRKLKKENKVSTS